MNGKDKKSLFFDKDRDFYLQIIPQKQSLGQAFLKACVVEGRSPRGIFKGEALKPGEALKETVVWFVGVLPRLFPMWELAE